MILYDLILLPLEYIPWYRWWRDGWNVDRRGQNQCRWTRVIAAYAIHFDEDDNIHCDEDDTIHYDEDDTIHCDQDEDDKNDEDDDVSGDENGDVSGVVDDDDA